MKADRASLIYRLVDEIIRDADKPEPTLATGISRLDDLLDGGLRGGEVFVLAARPRVGKSAAALQFSLEQAEQEKGVGIWTFEMKPKAWLRRAIAAKSGVDPRRIRRGTMNNDEIRSFLAACDYVRSLPLFFPKGADFEKEATELREAGVDLLVIDYLQLMRPMERERSREQEVAQLSGMIKRTALTLDVPILLLAQLNRNAEGKVPGLADLRESGAVEQDADEVFFLHRDLDADRHVLSNHGLGILAKNRDGESGSFALRYNWRAYRFEELTALAATA